MNIIITGGMGFIGHHVCSRLKGSHTVSSIDTLETYSTIPAQELAVLLDERTSLLGNNVPNYRFDIRISAASELIQTIKPDVILHLAAFPRAKVVDACPQWGSDVLTTGLINLLEAAKNANVKRFVYISSSMVYGTFKGEVNEQHQCDPKGLYGILKLAGEHIVKDFCQTNNIEYVILRPSAVYGPRDVLDRVVSKFFHNASRNQPLVVNGLNESLDFSYVAEVADAIANATTVARTANKTYNITRGRSRSILDAAELIKDIMQSRSEIQITAKSPRYPSRGTLDCSLAEEDFGFNPDVDIEKGFKYYYDWLVHSKFFDRIT